MWCKIVEVCGNLVALTRGYDSDEDRYYIRITIQADDFVPNSVAGEVSFSVYRTGKPFTEEEFSRTYDEDNVQAILEKSILPQIRALSE